MQVFALTSIFLNFYVIAVLPLQGIVVFTGIQNSLYFHGCVKSGTFKVTEE
jgi:hypothetical protein